jgi:hypothetical protein
MAIIRDLVRTEMGMILVEFLFDLIFLKIFSYILIRL